MYDKRYSLWNDVVARLGLALALAAVGSTAAQAQEVGQADVRLKSFSVRRSATTPDAFEVKVVVYSDNDDDAHDTQVYVFLPPETDVLSVPSNCAVAPLAGGYVSCSVGQLGNPGEASVAFATSNTPMFVLPRYAAVVFSQSADPDFRNNHAELIADTTLIRQTSEAEVYVIYGGAKFWVPDPAALFRLYGGWANVRVAADATLAGYTAIPSDGTILREENAAEVWLIEGGQRRHITTPAVLFNYGGWAVVGVVPDGSLSNLTIGVPVT